MSTDEDIYRALKVAYEKRGRPVRAKDVGYAMKSLGIPGIKLSILGMMLRRMTNVDIVDDRYVPRQD